MRRTIFRTGVLLALVAGMSGCSLVRPMLFWREPHIHGRAALREVDGQPLEDAEPSGVTVNFIHLGGRIDDSVVSVETDEKGRYRSPALAPGEYAVEALLRGFALEKQTVRVRSHEHKRVDIELTKIREAAGHFMREGDEDNIPQAGEVQISPPPF
jgi:hypothetical protein